MLNAYDDDDDEYCKSNFEVNCLANMKPVQVNQGASRGQPGIQYKSTREPVQMNQGTSACEPGNRSTRELVQVNQGG